MYDHGALVRSSVCGDLVLSGRVCLRVTEMSHRDLDLKTVFVCRKGRDECSDLSALSDASARFLP